MAESGGGGRGRKKKNGERAATPPPPPPADPNATFFFYRDGAITLNATFKNNSRGPFITITTAEEEARIISVASHSELTGIWFGPD